MKRILTIAISLFAFSSVFADDVKTHKPKYEEFNKATYKTKYVQMGASALPDGKDYTVAPSLTVGWLFKENNTGVDISVDAAYLEKEKQKKNEDDDTYWEKHDHYYSFSLPKVMLMHFVNPNTMGPYFGLGGSFNTKQTPKSKFSGLAANGVVGYNLQTGKKLLCKTQAGVGMPALAISKKGENVFRPAFELSLGLGF